MAVVISQEQNEIQTFDKWKLDIKTHRTKMEKRELEGEGTGSSNSGAGSSSSSTSSFMATRAYIDDDDDNVQYPGSEMNGVDDE